VTATWQSLHDELLTHLTTLEDREFVILGEPVTYRPGRSKLFRRRPRPLPSRFVQFLRLDEHLAGECVGPADAGGGWDISKHDQDRIRALGWDDTGRRELGAPNFSVELPRAEAARLAGMGVEALKVLGAAPGSLAFQRDM
jgi:hypothetical protein